MATGRRLGRSNGLCAAAVRASEVMGRVIDAASAVSAPEVETFDDTVMRVVGDLSTVTGWTRLMTVRDVLRSYDRATVDDALRRLHRAGRILLSPAHEPARLWPEGAEEAALTLGGESKHLVALAR